MNREDLVTRVLSAVVAVVVSAGFVAAVGGAVLWARFHAAKLPADQAVAAVPNDELGVVGAVALVAFIIAGLVALIGAYALDRSGTPGERTRRGLAVLMVAEIVVAICILESNVLTGVLLGIGFAILGVFAIYLLEDLERALKGRQPDAPDRPRWAERFLRWVTRQLFANVSLVEGIRRMLVTVLLVGGVFLVSLTDEWLLVALWMLAFVALLHPWNALRPRYAPLRRLIAVALIVYGLAAVIRYHDSLAALVIAAVLLALVNLGVAQATGERFAFYGIAVFLSVVLFGGLLSYVRTRDYPKLQGVAVVMKNGDSACGLYVTETDSRLYLARVDVVGGRKKVRIVDRSGRITWLPRDQIKRSELGPLQGVIPAQANAADLRDELLQEEKKPKPDSVAGLPKASECVPEPEALPIRQTEQRKLAEQFQPRLITDRSDGFWPISVLTIFRLRRGDQGTCRQVPGECIPTTRVVKLPWTGGVNEWLDYPAANTSKEQQHEDMVGALKSEDPAKTGREYFFVTGGKGSELTSLQYWFYYQFNYQRLRLKGVTFKKAGFHEGDFESIGLLLSRDSKEPRYLWMARHADEGRPFVWSEAKLERSGGHPTVYAARGSHATYEACGRQHRFDGTKSLIDDETACSTKQLFFEPALTPLSDLAFTPWACWRGNFGYSKLKRLPREDLLLANGPQSPLWQQNFRALAAPCAVTQTPPLRPDIAGEETVDDATATTLRANGGQLDRRFDRCKEWRKPPARGVYVVACSDGMLKRYFDSGLEEIGKEQITIGRGKQQALKSVPAIYRSPNAEALDGITIKTREKATASIYAACYSNNRRVVADFGSVPLLPNRRLVIRTTGLTWSLISGTKAVRIVKPMTSARRARCDT
jgi:VPS62-like protein